MSETSESPWYSLAFEKRAKKRVRSYEAPAPLAPIADTHAHLTCFWSKDPAECVARAALAGVRQLTTLWDPLGDKRSLATFQTQLAGWLDSARALLAEVPLMPQSARWYCFRTPTDPTCEVKVPKRYHRAEDAASEADAAGAEDAADTVNAAGAEAASGAGAGEGLLVGIESLPDHVRYLAGVHPYGAPDYTDEVHAQVLAALDDPRCAGIGEIGLDYHFDAVDDVAPAPHDVQMACMARQLEVAMARNLPVELHLRNADGDDAREAHADAARVLEQVGVPKAGCVLHCFGEDRATMERFVGMGCHIAYGGAATFGRNEPVREAFATTPLDRILFETDCPYMAPMPIRGLECEPAMIAFTVDALSRDRSARTGEDPAVIQWAAWENANRLLG